MASYFLDSSALVKRYVQERGSAWVNSLFDPGLDNDIFVAAITPVEIVAAIVRRTRGGSIATADAARTLSLLRTDLASAFFIVELTENVLDGAMRIAESHALRGYDAVQLAAALTVNSVSLRSGLLPISFVTADNELITVAELEALAVINPNDWPA